jgi:hypothetical protein
LISPVIDARDWYDSHMNVEDSYEGAIRRLQRLEMAGIAIDSPTPAETVDHGGDASVADRMRELEELALLACEDNERLKVELGTARAELESARIEIERAQKERDGIRREIEQLHAYVASLEQTLASTQQARANAPQQPIAMFPEPFVSAPPQQPFEPAPQQLNASAPQQPVEPPQQPFASASPFAASPFSTEASPEEDLGYPLKSSRKPVVYVLAVAAVAVVALLVLHPWDQPRAAAVLVEPPVPPAPVVSPPPPAAKVEPIVPKVAATIPKVAATIPKVAATIPSSAAAHESRASKVRSGRKHAKHHTGKKQAAATAKQPAPETTDDPLAGAGI